MLTFKWRSNTFMMSAQQEFRTTQLRTLRPAQACERESFSRILVSVAEQTSREGKHILMCVLQSAGVSGERK